MIYDVVVVGAGPAGASAAYVLARAGFRVAVVEREAFPRDKLCGGGLTGRAQKVYDSLFPAPWDEVIDCVSGGLHFYRDGRYVNGVDDYRPIHLTMRVNFDAFLMDFAIGAGAEFIQQNAVAEIAADRGGLLLRDGRRLGARCIVGADGANSRVAAAVLQQVSDIDEFALGLEIELPKALFPREVAAPEVHFGCVEWGYGWVFPKKDSLTIGIGGLRSKNPDMRPLFEAFLRQTCGFLPDIRPRGHHFPYGNYPAEPGVANVLLVGDAAGLVEPLTGEGLAYAMQSGKLAGEAIVEALREGRPETALQRYLPGYRSITSDIDKARWMRALIFSPLTQGIFFRALKERQGMIRRYCDLTAAERDYPTWQETLGSLMRWILRR
jgi:geranylgeranyl reductase family protein